MALCAEVTMTFEEVWAAVAEAALAKSNREKGTRMVMPPSYGMSVSGHVMSDPTEMIAVHFYDGDSMVFVDRASGDGKPRRKFRVEEKP